VPLLAIEVLSRSTRVTDATLKRLVFEQAGVPVVLAAGPRRARR